MKTILSITSVFMLFGCSSSMRFSSNVNSAFGISRNLITTSSYSTTLNNRFGDDAESPSNTVSDSTANQLEFEGNASYYGDEFQGRMTTNGEIFNQNYFTAAHRTLPFGTFLLVKNLRNNSSVVVRVNDRGPFKPDRILDLSHAAAEELDMLRDGIAKVRITVIE